MLAPEGGWGGAASARAVFVGLTSNMSIEARPIGRSGLMQHSMGKRINTSYCKGILFPKCNAAVTLILLRLYVAAGCPVQPPEIPSHAARLFQVFYDINP